MRVQSAEWEFLGEPQGANIGNWYFMLDDGLTHRDLEVGMACKTEASESGNETRPFPSVLELEPETTTNDETTVRAPGIASGTSPPPFACDCESAELDPRAHLPAEASVAAQHGSNLAEDDVGVYLCMPRSSVLTRAGVPQPIEQVHMQ